MVREVSVHRAGFLLPLLVIIGLPLAARQDQAGGGTPAAVAAFDPSRDAAADIDAAIAEAKRTGRNVLLDVGGEWCIWCKRLDALFEEHKDLAGFMHRNYVTVKVNYSKENKNEAVLSRYPKIAGYPHLFVLDATGKLLRSQETGALEKGKGHDPGKVMAFLKEWAPKKEEN
jgi:thiol:disulfide interchange protein